MSRFSAILFLGLSLTLWLLLGAPGTDFLRTCWVPTLAWIVFLALVCWAGAALRGMRVDMATYGPVGLTLGLLAPLAGLLLSGTALMVARYAGTGAGEGSVGWTASTQLLAIFVILLLLSGSGAYLLTHRSIGQRGVRPIIDTRGTMQSHPEPPRRAADLTPTAPDQPPRT